MDKYEKQFEDFTREIKFDDSPDIRHRHNLELKLLDAFSAQTPRQTIWRTIMKSNITKLAAAAAIIIAVALGVTTILNKSTTPAYAIEQTVAALQKVRTVHMFCRDWDGREFEIWMVVNPQSGQTEYARWGYGDDFIAISRLDTSYQYNKKSNYVQVKKEPLLGNWWRFETILEDASEAAKRKQKAVTIYHDVDAKTGKDVVVVYREFSCNAWKFIIDSETKLPVRMYCLRSNQPGEFARDYDPIYFDEQLPDGIFDFQIPKGARVEDSDRLLTLLEDPNYGISVEGLTQTEAATLAVTEYFQAIMTFDLERLIKVFPCAIDLFAKDEDLKNIYYGKYRPVELMKVEAPYVEHNCGFGLVTPCTIKCVDGVFRETRLIIKFRNINGKSSCVIAGTFGDMLEIEQP